MQLVIGNKNYSSWSMRPWLLLRHHAIAFEEIKVALFSDGYQQILAKYSPSLRVPVLIDNGHTIWDSLAICEYVSERYLNNHGYPADLFERARCRSFCNEMHAGFMSIRSQLPMNCRARRQVDFSDSVLTEIRRVDQIWSESRRQFAAGGDYLFGAFSIADCMYAPMALRFHTYGVPLSALARGYVDTLLVNAAVQQWRADAAAEQETLPDYELGVDVAALKRP